MEELLEENGYDIDDYENLLEEDEDDEWLQITIEIRNWLNQKKGKVISKYSMANKE